MLARTCSENGVINQIAGLDINVQSVISGVFLLVVVVAQRLLARTRA